MAEIEREIHCYRMPECSTGSAELATALLTSMYINIFMFNSSTYDHRVWKTGLPVRSAVGSGSSGWIDRAVAEGAVGSGSSKWIDKAGFLGCGKDAVDGNLVLWRNWSSTSTNAGVASSGIPRRGYLSAFGSCMFAILLGRVQARSVVVSGVVETSRCPLSWGSRMGFGCTWGSA